MLPKESENFVGIQILRAFAALAVLFYHLTFFLKQSFHTQYIFEGGKGVFLFFVISGFVLWNEKLESPIKFILYRISRIYPPYIVAVAIVLFFKTIILGVSTPFSFSSLTLLPLGSQIDYVLGIEWSLVYEVYFYLVLMLILFLPVNIRKYVPTLWFLALLIGIFLLNWNYKSLDSITRPDFSSILLSSFCLPFVMGLITRQIFNSNVSELGLLALIFILGAFGTNILLLQLVIDTNHLAYVHLLAGFEFCLIVYVFAKTNFNLNNKIISYLYKMGSYSYGLYLLHASIITTLINLMIGHGYNYFTIFIFTLCSSYFIGVWYGKLDAAFYARIRKLIQSYIP